MPHTLTIEEPTPTRTTLTRLRARSARAAWKATRARHGVDRLNRILAGEALPVTVADTPDVIDQRDTAATLTDLTA